MIASWPVGVRFQGDTMRYMILPLFMLCSCSAINTKLGLADDNPIEEIGEAVIEAKTGLDIDLTPGSPE